MAINKSNIIKLSVKTKYNSGLLYSKNNHCYRFADGLRSQALVIKLTEKSRLTKIVVKTSLTFEDTYHIITC